jgi:hypothetical protein
VVDGLHIPKGNGTMKPLSVVLSRAGGFAGVGGTGRGRLVGVISPMYSVRLFGIVTMNSPLYNEYILIKNSLTICIHLEKYYDQFGDLDSFLFLKTASASQVLEPVKRRVIRSFFSLPVASLWSVQELRTTFSKYAEVRSVISSELT